MKKNVKKTTVSLIALIAGMFMLSFASVPLYNLFCKVTGFGGTPKINSDYQEKIGTRKLKILFNADTNPDLKWEFKTMQRQIKTVTGKRELAFFYAKNLSDKPITGTAIYNVTPNKAGAYFNKIACFCFERQTLKPGEEMQFPVSFYIDPAMENDPYLNDVKTITLSYSFFKAK